VHEFSHALFGSASFKGVGAMGLSLAWTVGLAAMLAYTAAAWPVVVKRRWPDVALALGWVAHGVALGIDIVGTPGEGARFGFAPALSATVWIVIAVHAIESRMLPLPAVRLLLAVSATAVVFLATVYPGEARASAGGGAAWLPLHWLLGVVSYGLFAVAVLHAWLLDGAERRLRGAPAAAASGLPLLQLERLTFRFVEIGFVVLSIALVIGILLAERWRWDHKTVLSLLGWMTFAVLIAGRHWRGWRGRQATRWVYAGAILLLLAYAGFRFVLEVILRRGAGGAG
jgi:ABC-type uncharacterized transport system permease subunit